MHPIPERTGGRGVHFIGLPRPPCLPSAAGGTLLGGTNRVPYAVIHVCGGARYRRPRQTLRRCQRIVARSALSGGAWTGSADVPVARRRCRPAGDEPTAERFPGE